MSDKKKKKRVGSVIFRIVLIIIAGLTVGLGVFSWNAAGLLGNQLPMPFGFGASVVLSPSMEPTLHTNDLVFVTKADSCDVGDIVVYQEGNMLIIHRIISIDGDNVITKGDANNVADDPIKLDDIKAKYTFRIPFVGLIIKYIKTVPGTLLVLILAIFLLYRSRQKEREKDKEELEDIVEEINRLRSLQSESDNAKKKQKDADAFDQLTAEKKEAINEASEPAEKAENEEEGASEPTEKAEDEEGESDSLSQKTVEKKLDTAAYGKNADIEELKSILKDMSE